MKRKLKQRIHVAIGALAAVLLALPATLMAQKGAIAQPPLNPKLQGYAAGGSTANWIDFREGTNINPKTIFTDLKDAFELSDNDEMKLVKSVTDEIGFTHYWYQQYYRNLKVLYGEFNLHQTKEGFVRTANGRLITGLNLGSNATVSEQQGLEAALSFMHAKKYLWQNPAMESELKRQQKDANATYYPKGELLYAPNNNGDTYLAKEYRLAWHYKVYTDDRDVTAKSVYVDAVTGNVIRSVDIAMNCAGGTGGSAYNGTVSFSTELNGGSYRSHNDCQATDIYVYNCNGGGATNTFYNDADNTWTDPSAVQAQWGALMTYNYYIGQHSRASWDGASGDLIAYNNAFAGSNNACWGCTGNQAIFYAGSTSAANDDWNTNDIMGHEFTHGVTQASAGLVYSGESGALNESFSDIFGEMVESWSEGNCDYLIGADRGAIRSMIDPPAYSDYAGTMPDTYLGTGWYTGSTDNSGVHHNSSVQNHWFYLLSEGGSGTTDFGVSYSVTGITRFKARLIAYRALTAGYMNSSSKYIDARAASLHAALDLYGQCSPEIIAVGDAWHAVGVESQSAQFTKNACGTYSSGEFVQAISQLTAANGCATTVNSATNTVYFTARDHVILYPGFIAPAGSKFVAYLEPCSSTMWKNGTDNGHIIMSDAEKGIKAVVPVAKTAPPMSVAEQQSGISVVPNPFKSKFDITLNAVKDAKAQIRVYNSLGMSVIEKADIKVAKGSNKVSIDGSNLPVGTYLVEIYNGEMKTVKKIVKVN